MRIMYGSFRSSRLCVDTVQTHCSKDGKFPERSSRAPAFPTPYSTQHSQEIFGKTITSGASIQCQSLRFQRAQGAERMQHIREIFIRAFRHSIKKERARLVQTRCLSSPPAKQTSTKGTCHPLAIFAGGLSCQSLKEGIVSVGRHISLVTLP